jgi:putative heme-binding domain-containing protein
VGIVAVLARSGDEEAQSYLRQIWDTDPERRATVAMGLAQTPDLANWEYLVRSLPVLQGALAAEVLKQLREIDRKPEEPEHYRQVILRGLILGDEGGRSAVELLEQWTGESQSGDDDTLSQTLTAWQKWFAATYPDQPPAELPKQSETSKWQFTELLDYLEGEQGAEGSVTRGAEVFAKVQCAKCHRFGDIGEVAGPDLTGISRRFTRREILESILFPSHVISNQFASKTVITVDGRSLSGMVADGEDGQRVVLQSDGTKVSIAEDEIDEIQTNRTSSMPEGLLNALDLQAISDLFAYLGQPQRNVARQPDTQTVK